MSLRSTHASPVLQAIWHMALSLPQAGELKLRDNGTAHCHFVRSQNGHFQSDGRPADVTRQMTFPTSSATSNAPV